MTEDFITKTLERKELFNNPGDIILLNGQLSGYKTRMLEEKAWLESFYAEPGDNIEVFIPFKEMKIRLKQIDADLKRLE